MATYQKVNRVCRVETSTDKGGTNQLYFIGEGPVLENDWFIDGGRLFKAFAHDFNDSEGNPVLNIPNEPAYDFGKIVCTTHFKIVTDSLENLKEIALIPPSFIRTLVKYIEKGRTIKSVLVEFELYNRPENGWRSVRKDLRPTKQPNLCANVIEIYGESGQ